MAIIDILYGEFVANIGYNPAVLTDDNSLTVDNTFTHVDIENLLPPNSFVMVFKQYVTGYYYFQAKDNINILSCGIFMPFHFVPGYKIPKLGLYTTNASELDWYNINEFDSNNSVFPLPSFNYELSLNIFVRAPYSVDYCLGSRVSGDASMIGVPASLNSGTLVYPIPYIKILHTLPMVA